MSSRDERHRMRIERARQRRRTARRRKRRPWSTGRRMVAVVAGVVVVGGGAAVASRLLDGGPTAPARRAQATREGSTVVPGAPPVTIERTPQSFHVVYRLEEFTGPRVAVSTDEVWVRRPFESRLETRNGPPPGEERATLQVGRFASRLNVGGGDAAAVITGVPPSVAPSDIRLAPVLDAALAAGLLERREVRTVLDRRCQVYRSGEPLSAAVLTPPAPDDHAESCVDAAGLVLEELLVIDDEVLSRRIAVDVDEEPDLDDDLFVTGKRTLEPKDGGGLVRRMGEGLPPGEFLLVPSDAVPEGFSSIGRFNVIPSQAENFTDPERERARETSFVDAFVRSADFLVVDQGGTLRGTDPYAPDPDAPAIDLGPYGIGETRLSAVGVEVRVKRSGGRFLRVRGTLPPEELAAVARSLTPTEGTGPLEFLEEPGSPEDRSSP